MNKINIAIAGLGTVGSEVAKQLQTKNEFLSKKAGRKLNLIAYLEIYRSMEIISIKKVEHSSNIC